MTGLTSFENKVIWIIGASSGIGASLAKELAGRGAFIAISARRAAELEELKSSLAEGLHTLLPLDVRDSVAINNAATRLQAEMGKIDAIIYLAGLYQPMNLDSLDLEQTKQIIEVNLLGVFNALDAMIPIFKQQGFGQIALCASVAGFVGLPGGQPYSATKAGIISLAESLRAELPDAIDVKLINPGFVKTQLTDKNSFKMPMILSPERAACEIANGLLTKGFEIHFPWRFSFLLKIMRLLPYNLLFKILRHIK